MRVLRGPMYQDVATLNIIANLAIVVGYVLVPLTWLRYLAPALCSAPSVLLAGVVFFLTCALTHLAMTFHAEHEEWMVVDHVVQAVSVIYFVLGLGLLLRRADRLVREAEARLAESRTQEGRP